MVHPPELRDDLKALERFRLSGEKRPTVQLCGVLLERLLKYRANWSLHHATGKRRDQLLKRLEGDSSSIDRLMLHPLMQLLQGDGDLDRRRGELYAVIKGRNWAAHDTSTEEPSGLAVEGYVDLIWWLVETLELKEAGWRTTLRDEILRQSGGMRGRPARVAGMLVDRVPQKRKVREEVAVTLPALLVVVHGERDQGHSEMARFCLGEARKLRSGCWQGLGPVVWPPAGLPEPVRWGSLIERTAREVLNAEITQAATLVERLQSHFARGDRVFLRLQVPDPDPSGAELFARYTQEVWRPVVEDVPDLVFVGTIEADVLPPGGWFPWSAANRAAKRARDGVDRIVSVLHGTDGMPVLALDELHSLTADEIEYALPQSLREHLSQPEAEALAKDIFDKTQGGRFGPVLKFLESM